MNRVIVIFLILIFYSCSEKNTEIQKYSGFEKFITGYTTGIVPQGSTIKVRFTKDIKTDVKVGSIADASLFTFEPQIKGKAYWINSREVEFIPDKSLKRGQTYNVKFNIGKLIDVERRYRSIPFKFTVMQQDFNVNINGLKTYEGINDTVMYLTGSIVTADYLSREKVEKIINGRIGNNKLIFSWEHSKDGKMHEFRIDNIGRKDSKQLMKFSWDGSFLGVEEKGEKDITIPEHGAFYLINIYPELSNAKRFRINFSDKVDSKQDLRGLIKIEGYNNLRFSVYSNYMYVYTETEITGKRTVTIDESLRSTLGKTLGKTSSMVVWFEESKPAVKFIGKGSIVPSSEGLIIPFSSVGLKTVDLRVIKIYENNIHQFFQKNAYDGNYDIKMVGRLILNEKIDIDKKGKALDISKWNDFTIDLADYIEIEPGAMYRVDIRFKKEYSSYGEEETIGNEDREYKDIEEKSLEMAKWDALDWYSHYYYPDGYIWRERNNPNHISYYNSQRFISRNVLASNLGVIAKTNGRNELKVFVSNLKTTEPMSGVDVIALNLQKQIVGRGVTDKKGFVDLELSSKAFLIIAEDINQKSYLRVDDGSSLSISNFDVDGAKMHRGLKGFIYGERGVWRPGDKIFLSFFLEDKKNTLPPNYPVVAELFNSRGQFVKRIINTSSNENLYCFTFKTDSEAPTGNWTVNIKVGGAVFSKKIKVETIKPNRLKIDLKIEGDIIKQNSPKDNILLDSEWLHGANAPNLSADIKMSLSGIKTSFEGFSQYIFDDPSKDFYSSDKIIFKGKTDKTGKANIPLKIGKIKNAPGMLKANFVTRVFEKSGDFSVSSKSCKLSPYSSYVGIKVPESEANWYKTNEKQNINIICIDEDGNNLNRKVFVKLYKINWRWWWDSDRDNLASYINGHIKSEKYEKTVNIVDGKGIFSINVPSYGRYLIRVIDPVSKHSCGHIMYFSSWVGVDMSSLPGGANILSLSADKREYNVGDEVKIRIPSSKEGKALVSLENGDGIVDAFLVETSDKETFFSFKANEKMSPNIYVNVSLIQPHAGIDNDHPMRLYGIIPVKVTNPKTILKPVINIKKELKPENDFDVKVSESTGEEMNYTIAIVDEGLLALTSYKTPDPWKTFYTREALGVKTWDLYDYVMGAYGARLESAFAIGGDEELSGEDNKRAERFKPVVMFKGPFKLEKGKTNKHKFKMPNYIGAVRTMVIAGNNGAYGKAQEISQVSKPLMITAALPRILTPGDMVKIPVTVFTNNDKIRDVKLYIDTHDNIINVGNLSKTIYFNKAGEQIVEFTVMLPKKTGKAKIKIFAESGAEKSSFEVEADIRLPNPSYSVVKEAVIAKGNKTVLTEELWGIEGTNKAVLELSTLPPMNIESRLDYLIKYPHGCLEQIISAVFPQIFLNDIVDLNEKQKEDIMNNVRVVIDKLLSYQKHDGSLSYWPGGSYINKWAEIYAGNFMIEAEKKGFHVPKSLIAGWLKKQRKVANSWNYYGKYRNSDLIQAYRLYVIALAGRSDIGAMNRMREKANIPVAAKWRLAASYAIIGRNDVAESIISSISEDIKPYKELSSSFGTHIRDWAMVLETLCLMGKEEEAYKMAIKIAKELGSDTWMSTQTTAYSLMGITNFMKKYDSKDSNLTYDLIINKNKNKFIDHKSFVRHSIDIEKERKINTEIKNNGEGLMYARLITTAVPMVSDKADKCKYIDFSVRYLDSEGNQISIDSIEQGKDIIAEFTVRNKSYSGKLEQMVISAMFPSGWEIINSRLWGGINNDDKVDYMDIRDDRIYFYFSLATRESKTFRVNLNASFKGDFYMPMISCSAMYDNDINAIVPGNRTKVIKAR